MSQAFFNGSDITCSSEFGSRCLSLQSLGVVKLVLCLFLINGPELIQELTCILIVAQILCAKQIVLLKCLGQTLDAFNHVQDICSGQVDAWCVL